MMKQFPLIHELNFFAFLRFVSDHGPVGCQALLQHRLIQANQKTQLSSGSAPEASRTYPLSLLEWTANRKKANMVLQVHCFDGGFHVPHAHARDFSVDENTVQNNT